LRSKIRQLEEQDRELLKLHERNGDLGLEVQNLNEQLEKERTDREKVEGELSDLKQECEKLQLENSDLKQKSAAANKDLPDATDVKQEPARTSDLSYKAAKVLNFFKPLLNKKAPTDLLPKVEEILEES
jgi:chromosome segregation ATPase